MIWAAQHKTIILLTIAAVLMLIFIVKLGRKGEQTITYLSPLREQEKQTASELPEEKINAQDEMESGLVLVYQDLIPLKGIGILKIEVKIHEEDQVPLTKGLSCATPFFVDYGGAAVATIRDTNGVVKDKLFLTPTALALGKQPDYDFSYYQLHDMDGDGVRGEFLILSYFICNANFLKVAKIDFENEKFVFVPFRFDEKEYNRTFVGPTKRDFGFGGGELWVRNYDMFTGKFTKTFFLYQKGGFFREIAASTESL